MATKMIPEAEQLLAESSSTVRELMRGIYEYFVSEAGCNAYVKTIYVGFMIDGQMVAAAYPHARSVEVALALPDDVEGPGLIDAAHLTWRTMPVAVEISDREGLKAARAQLETAVARVQTGIHDVELPQDRFIGRERNLTHRKIVGKSPNLN